MKTGHDVVSIGSSSSALCNVHNERVASVAARRTLASLAGRRSSVPQNDGRHADHDALLTEAFLHASRVGHTEVVAVNEHLFMTTSGAAAYVSVVDQSSLWQWARVRRAAGPTTLHLDGRSPMSARCKPVVDGAMLAGMLVELKAPFGEARLTACGDEGSFRSVLPGSSRQAIALRIQLAHAAKTGAATLISGEPGTGKATVARRLLDPDEGGHHIQEFDGAGGGAQSWIRQVGEALQRSRVLLTHLDELPSSLLSAVMVDLARRGPNCRVVATVGTSGQADAIAHDFGVHLELPPLRDRLEDLPEIANHVLARRPRRGVARRLDSGVRRQLWGYHWPGNVAELEQVMHSAAMLAPTSVVDESCLRMPAGNRGGLGAHRRTMVEAAEIDTLLDALDRCGGNKLAAADMLGISRSTLYRKAAALGVSTA